MPIDYLIHGDAPGADTLADMIGRCLLGDDRVLPFPADWGRFHRGAGPIRNRQMLAEGKPTEVIGFHKDITKSKGTRDMLAIAKEAGIPTRLYVE